MSTTTEEQRHKRDRACDACRRRKTKCDGPSMSTRVCSNCTQTRKPCTYVEESKPRGPPKAYITGLEDRLEALEALLQQVSPGADYSEELGPPVVRDSWKDEDDRDIPSNYTALHSSLTTNVLPPLLVPYGDQPSNGPSSISPASRSTHLVFRAKPRSERSIPKSAVEASFHSYRSADNFYDDDSSSSSSEEETEEIIVTSLVGREKFTLCATENADATEDNNIRFHGRSSTAGLVETTRQFKHMHMRDIINPTRETPLPAFPDNLTVAQWRRREFWARPDWEYSYEGADSLDYFLEYFPPPDLATTLIALYFQHSNPIFPLLHLPTFTRQWKDRLHTRNIWFAAVCTSMFAVASRWCDDERILPERSRPDDGKPYWTSAGRKYFDIAMDIHRLQRSLFHPPSLFEVQALTLMEMYLRGTSMFPAAWTLVSVGLRKAQDVGAHRKKVYRTEPNADDELWKRAFWHLVILDRLGGANLGRACGIAEEDFDLDLPLEVDDEFWETTVDQRQEPFKQPPGVPSSMTAFIQLIKLTQIMAFAMRTLYAIDKSKIYHGFVKIEQQTITKQLSLAMSEWLERVPEHLKWNDRMDDSVFLNQSAFLYTLYYLTQMLVHRPLIAMAPDPTTNDNNLLYRIDSPPSIPALTDPAIIICTEAAKACTRIVGFQQRQGLHNFYLPTTIDVSYICCGLFLLTAWNLKLQEKENQKRGTPDVKPPLSTRIEEDVANAQVFLEALEATKDRWEVVDILLYELKQPLTGLENLVNNVNSQYALRPLAPPLDTANSTAYPSVERYSLESDFSPQRHHVDYHPTSTSSTKNVQNPNVTSTLKYTRSATDLRTFSGPEPTVPARHYTRRFSRAVLGLGRPRNITAESIWAPAFRPPPSAFQSQFISIPPHPQDVRPRTPSPTIAPSSGTEPLGGRPYTNSLRRASSWDEHGQIRRELPTSYGKPEPTSINDNLLPSPIGDVKYEGISMPLNHRESVQLASPVIHMSKNVAQNSMKDLYETKNAGTDGRSHPLPCNIHDPRQDDRPHIGSSGWQAPTRSTTYSHNNINIQYHDE